MKNNCALDTGFTILSRWYSKNSNWMKKKKFTWVLGSNGKICVKDPKHITETDHGKNPDFQTLLKKTMKL